MIALAKHIEFLLQDNDCVIVPDFGGFIIYYQAAHYVAEESSYYPPVRTIGFNSLLTMNDGLLAQSYMQAYHTDFSEAMRRIRKAVAALKECLYVDGYVELQGIGQLHYNIQGRYEFYPLESGVLAPELYGLDVFHVEKLSADRTLASANKDNRLETRRKKTTIRLERSWIGNAVAAAVAVVLFFSLSVPVENTYVEEGNYASLGTDGLFEAIRSRSLATTLIAVPEQPQELRKAKKEDAVIKNNRNTLKPSAIRTEKVEKNPVKVEVKPEAKPKTDIPVARQRDTRGNYCIIVSSLAMAKDAEQVLNDYRKKGYSDAKIVEGSGRYRLSLCDFADKSTAYKKLKELRQDERFKSAWIWNAK